MTSTVTDRLGGVTASLAIKAPVAAATTGAVMLEGIQTIDGVGLAAGDRVLVKDQVGAAENGIYVVSTGSWSRAKDFDGARDAVQGTVVYVAGGTTNAGQRFRVDTADPITIGTTGISWVLDNTGIDTSTATVTATGSVTARTLANRFADVFNVKDHGATGDGATDDTDAIDDCAEAINANGGGAMFFPDGTYIISGDGCRIYDNTHVFGGRNVILRNTGTGADVACLFIERNSHNIVIEDLRVQGPYHAGGAVTYEEWNHGILVYGAFYRDQNPKSLSLGDVAVSTNIHVRNVHADGFAGTGIQFDSVTRGSVRDCFVEHCGRQGIFCLGAVECDISGNIIDDITPGSGGSAPNLNAYGISLTRRFNTPESEYPRSARCTVTNNRVSNVITWKGLDTHGGQDIVFSDNVVHECHIGVGVDSGGTNMNATHIRVESNILRAGDDSAENGRRAGVTLFDNSGIGGVGSVVCGNTIVGYGLDTGGGAIHVGDHLGYEVSRNIIRESLRAAINVNANSIATFGSILNNYIRDVTTSSFSISSGIRIEDTDAIAVISGNVIERTTGTLTGINLSFPDSNKGAIIGLNTFIDLTTDINQANRALSIPSMFAPFSVEGADVERVSVKAATALVTAASGATVSASNLVPAGAQFLGIVTRVTTALGDGNGTTGYNVGDGTDADRWGAVTGITEGTTSDHTDFTADPRGFTASALSVVLTAVGGNFDGTGVIRVTAFYIDFTAPAS